MVRRVIIGAMSKTIYYYVQESFMILLSLMKFSAKVCLVKIAILAPILLRALL